MTLYLNHIYVVQNCVKILRFDEKELNELWNHAPIYASAHF